ncbi:MAG: membrane protein insertase YidC, partial [Pseudomonadales bacterium]
MMLQWNQDYGTPAAEPTQVTSVSAYQDDTVSTDFAITTEQKAVVNNTEQAQAILVEVRTDTLQVSIDTRGGDIIHADLMQYLKEMDNPDVPFNLLQQSASHTYVAQSGLVGIHGTDAVSRPVYSVKQPTFTMGDDEDSLDVTLSFTDQYGAQIDKIYTFTRGSHIIKLTYKVNNQSSQPWSANLFGQLKRDRAPDPTQSSGMGMAAYLGSAFSLTDEKYKRIDFDDMDEENLKATTKGGWVAMLQHYFVSAWVPNAEQEHNYSTRVSNGNYIAGFVSPAMTLQPGQQGVTSAQLYVGPKIQEDLEAISEDLDLVVDYGWLWWIAQPLFWLLNTLYGFVGNWGVAIILVTLCVKAFFFYPSAVSYRSMAKMRALAP